MNLPIPNLPKSPFTIHIHDNQVAVKVSIDHHTTRVFGSAADAAHYRRARAVRAKCLEEFAVRSPPPPPPPLLPASLPLPLPCIPPFFPCAPADLASALCTPTSPRCQPPTRSPPSLHHQVYQQLDAAGRGRQTEAARDHGIPTAYGAGAFCTPTPAAAGGGTLCCSWMAMQLLGGSFERGVWADGDDYGADDAGDGATAEAWGGGPKTLRALSRVGCRALRALSWVHGHGLIHRDIKV